MRKLIYLLLTVLLFASCESNPTVSENKDLPIVAFSGEALAQPITTDNEFILLMKKDENIALTKIDAEGTKTELLSISEHIPENYLIDANAEYYLVPDTEKGNFTVYTCREIVGQDTISSVGIIKADNSGNFLWIQSVKVDSINNYSVSFKGAFQTSDNGIALIFATNKTQGLQKYRIKIFLFDADGNNIGDYISDEYDTYFSKIIMNNKEQIIVFPNLNSGGPGVKASTLLILDKNAKLIESKDISLDLLGINTIFEVESRYIITGNALVNNQLVTKALVFDSDFNIQIANVLPNNFFIYSYLNFSGKMLVVGAESLQPNFNNWINIYSQENFAAWYLLNQTGEILYEYYLDTDISTTAVSAIATSENTISILAVRKSYYIYNEVILIKATIDLTE